ncbi:MAG TPA: hypothetical protein VKU19_14440 [Bryobacteraceae bacterium]|nr:hypothetical protein [Bryobacteraceae bacterium]
MNRRPETPPAPWVVGGGQASRPQQTALRITDEPTAKLFFLLQIPELARKHTTAKGAIIQAGKLMPFLAKDKEILGVDLGNDRSVRQLVWLGMPYEVTIQKSI